MRLAAVIAVVLLAVAGCGGEESDGRLGASKNTEPSYKEEGGRTLTGCLKLWEGPHTGSTRVQNLAKTNVIAARVEVVKGKCEVALASTDGKVYMLYAEQPNVTGDWMQTKESASKKVALDVVRKANAQAMPDGSLRPGAP